MLEVTGQPEYPKTLETLEFGLLMELNTQYHDSNDGQICSTLNEYGFTGFSNVLFTNGVNPCTEREVVRVELNQPDTLLSAAKRALFYNRAYTLVTDTSQLELIESLPLEGCTICEGPRFNNVVIGWKFTFGNQWRDGIEVLNSTITVFLDANGVNRIWGNWYPDFQTPEFINVGYNQAKERVKGMQLDLKPVTGQDSVLTVGQAHMQLQPQLKYLATGTERGLELRKIWNVQILTAGDAGVGWEALIDVYDGTVIALQSKEL